MTYLLQKALLLTGAAYSNAHILSMFTCLHNHMKNVKQKKRQPRDAADLFF
jgi:hypothetical protein